LNRGDVSTSAHTPTSMTTAITSDLAALSSSDVTALSLSLPARQPLLTLLVLLHRDLELAATVGHHRIRPSLYQIRPTHCRIRPPRRWIWPPSSGCRATFLGAPALFGCRWSSQGASAGEALGAAGALPWCASRRRWWPCRCDTPHVTIAATVAQQYLMM
jgi:hypothetical protein